MVIKNLLLFFFFNSKNKTVININKYGLDKSFQKVLFRLNIWSNKGSAWTTEYNDVKYIDISIYNPFSGSPYIELPDKLKNSMKGLINIKNNDNKCFL